MNETETKEDWRSDVSSQSEVLKIQDGEKKQIVFMDEGNKVTHPDFGTSIVFSVSESEELKRFFVKANNFALLAQIKELGKLTGKKAEISRKGSKRSDTRYTITLSE